MTAVFTEQRTPVPLGGEIARGGEGAVYEVVGRNDVVVKVYTQHRDGYDEKVRWMVEHPPSLVSGSGHVSIAWPTELLYDSGGGFAGYVMPRVRDTVTLLKVYNPTLRARVLPGFDQRYLHRAARNLSAALAALHESDYVVGDLNESNVLVAPSSLVVIIDTDSFQVRHRRGASFVIYPCPVGKDELLPPELLGSDRDEQVRGPQQDVFSLAILLFHLLMEGGHPYRAEWRGSGDQPEVPEKIRRGCFPYQPNPPCPVSPPKTVIPFVALHPGLQALFRQCFSDGSHNPGRRPGARDWEQAVIAAEQALVVCPHGHIYSSHSRACPRCGATPSRAKPAPAPSRARPAPANPTVITPATTGSSIACPNCAQMNARAEVYCQHCVCPLHGVKHCRRCGHQIPGNAPFCTKCGRRQ